MLFSMFILTRYGLAIHKPHLRLKKNSEIESHFYLSSLSSFETGRKVAGHNFWKNEIAQGHNINPLESNGSKMADKSTLTRPSPSISKLNAHPEVPWQFQGTIKRSKSGPISRNLYPFPKIVGINLQLVSLWNYPAHKNYATFLSPQSRPLQVGFSLNKSISYLSLCLSLNSLCDETSRTWASLYPETRYHGFWLGLSPSHVG